MSRRVEKEWVMKQRLVILVAMVAMMFVVAAPAMAQDSSGSGETAATGILRAGLPADVLGEGTHSITDEATGTLYALRSAGADLDAYVGQSVTVYGALTPGEDFPDSDGIASGTLPSIDVSRIEPTQAAPNKGTTSVSPSTTGEVAGTTSGDQYAEATPSSGTTTGSSEAKGLLATVLPDTGGLPLGVLAAGVLLLGTGALAARRFFR